jgi:hypothetical protein
LGVADQKEDLGVHGIAPIDCLYEAGQDWFLVSFAFEKVEWHAHELAFFWPMPTFIRSRDFRLD